MPDSAAIRFHELAGMTGQARADLCRRAEADLDSFTERVRPIIAAVRDEGDAALARFAADFDKSPVEPHAIAATEADFDRAFHALDPEMIAVLDFASDNIRRFHQAQMPEEMWLKEVQPGLFAGEKTRALDSVACYVPRGKGAFPSVVLMTAIPAVVAGVPDPIIITPPGPDGGVDAATLVAARMAGIDKVYKAGGAQGVAAVAYGTETVPRCLKIVGPGSPWVVAAKRLLADRIDPGPPAGPSEAIILADETANGAVAGLDLLIEAEHGPDSSAYLVTNSRAVADAARDAIPGYWARMGDQRVAFSTAVLCGARGGIVLARDMDDAIAFVNEYAPEHLEIQSKEPFAHLGRIENAGEILLGEHTPVCIGNFVLGPNAVLPTNRMSRVTSPLGVFDYLKRMSVGYVTKPGYDSVAAKVHTFATYEGFDAHANAVSDLRVQAFGEDADR